MDFIIKMDHTETQLFNQFCDIVPIKISFVSVAVSSETPRQVKTLKYKGENTKFFKNPAKHTAHTRIPTLSNFRCNTPESYAPPDALLSAFEHTCCTYTCI